MRIRLTLWKAERVSQIGWVFFLPVLLASTMVSAQSNRPALYYASAKAGPNQGWANSSTKGAAITIWGRDFGTTRGTSYVTVAGVNLTNASDYGEWGATTNPTTAKGFQRITFWLNSSMALGATTISVTVGGVTGNTLPFTIDNTASSRIRFVDPVKGSESYDGRYPDHSLGGRHGPWLYPFSCTTKRSGWPGPGAFMYMRGGTYTNMQSAGWHYPRQGCVGAADAGHPPYNNSVCPANGRGLNWYYCPQDGTDALRITMTEYPGENAHFFNASIWDLSSYWTFANFTMDGDLTYGPSDNIYIAMVIGFEQGYCNGNTYFNHGDRIVGMAFIGNMHVPIQAWGIGMRFSPITSATSLLRRGWESGMIISCTSGQATRPSSRTTRCIAGRDTTFRFTTRRVIAPS